MALSDDELLKQLKFHGDSMFRDRDRFLQQWREIGELMLPRKSNIDNEVDVQREHRRFDATGMTAAERLSASIVGTMTPQSLDWFELGFGLDANDTRSQELDDWGATVSKKMHESLQQSNFAAEFEEALLDCVVFGNLCLFQTLVPQNQGGNSSRPAFEAWPIQDYAFSEGAMGLVNRVQRKHEMTVEQIAVQFGKEKLPEDLQRDFDKVRLKKFEVKHDIWDRGSLDEDISPEIDVFPTASVFWMQKSGQNESTILSKGGFHEFPAHVGRWRKMTGEVNGYGPGFTALPDVQSLNEADKLGLMAWGNQIAPPLLQLAEGVLGKHDLRAMRLNTITH